MGCYYMFVYPLMEFAAGVGLVACMIWFGLTYLVFSFGYFISFWIMARLFFR